MEACLLHSPPHSFRLGQLMTRGCSNGKNSFPDSWQETRLQFKIISMCERFISWRLKHTKSFGVSQHVDSSEKEKFKLIWSIPKLQIYSSQTKKEKGREGICFKSFTRELFSGGSILRVSYGWKFSISPQKGNFSLYFFVVKLEKLSLGPSNRGRTKSN